MKITLSIYILVFSIAVISCGSDKKKSESKVDVTDNSTVNELSAGDLRAAALNGNLQTVSEAIGHGVPPDEPDELGCTALMFAAFNGHTEVVQLLIDEEACNGPGADHVEFANSKELLADEWTALPSGGP